MAAFSALSVAFLYKAHLGRAAAAAAAAVMFKQMALLMAPYWLAAGLSLLGHTWRSHGRTAACAAALRAAAGAGSVIAVALLPFFLTGTLSDVFARVFPVARGLYEDKVATVWCALSPILKVQVRGGSGGGVDRCDIQPLLQVLMPDKSNQALLCAASALVAAAPSLFSFFRARAAPHTAIHNAFLAVTAAFLFGYQMHEKTVLLPLVILSLAFPRLSSPVICTTIACLISMHDLLRRDGHALSYNISMLALITAALYMQPPGVAARVQRAATIGAVVLFHAAEAFLPPPAKYPWLFPYFAALLCCSRQVPPPSQPHTSPGSLCNRFSLDTFVIYLQLVVVIGISLLAEFQSPL
jgi:alpha-1,3-glucosyltransferase